MGKLVTSILNTLLAIIAGTLIFYTAYMIVFSLYLRTIVVPSVIIPTVVAEEKKPSYEYLKSITVRVSGKVKKVSEFFDFPDIRNDFYEELDLETIGWVGTGVVIKIDEEYTYILTNKHVAGGDFDNPTIYVRSGSRVIEVEVVESHQTLDVAVLRLKGKIKEKQVVKGYAEAKPQDRVFLVGHHLGRAYLYGEGVFAGYDEIFSIIQIPCAFGNSGSGVVDKDGNLVALVFAVNQINLFEVDEAHAVAIDGLSVELFLEKLNLI